MKIHDSAHAGAYQIGKHRAAESQGVDAGASSPSQRPNRDAAIDRVEVSEAAATVSRVLELNEARRAAEIESLRNAYRHGELKVDSRALSRAMLADEVAANRIEQD